MGNKIHHQWRNEMSDVGTCHSRDGQRQADSLLMHTITSSVASAQLGFFSAFSLQRMQ
jgi:hypothetical protein